MKKHKPKKMTLEKLARMVQRGFEQTATKKELQALREEMNQRFEVVDQRFEGVANQIDALYSEIKEIKSVLPPLIRAMSQFEVEVINLRQRVVRLEKKVGLSR